MRKLLVRAVLALLLLLALLNIASANGLDVPWATLSGGGGRVAGGGLFLGSAIGLPLGGTTSGGGYVLCSGYWCGLPAWAVRLFQPIIISNFTTE